VTAGASRPAAVASRFSLRRLPPWPSGIRCSGTQRGDFLQALYHLALIVAACRLRDAEAGGTVHSKRKAEEATDGA
jgi:hypothetical protein